VRRELWEYRSIYIAPLAVAAVFLLGFIISLAKMPHRLLKAVAAGDGQVRGVIQQPYDMAALAVMAATFLISIYYCLDALHGERRDRSILFWKSLPVSDLTAVLAKAAIPLVVIPPLTFFITVVLHSVMMALNSLAFAASGIGTAVLWSNISLFRMWLVLFYHLTAVHALWFAPCYAWLLLISAWARRSPFLWAALPPLAIAGFEKLVFNTTYVLDFLARRLGGAPQGTDFPPGDMAVMGMMHLDVVQLLLSPGLWIGFAFTAVFLFLAARVRRERGPN
jgi:ABC-2 type transport system permease protein